MIKINLLPPHVAERRKVRGLLVWIVLALLIEVAGVSFYVYRLSAQEAQKTALLADAKGRADQVRDLEQRVAAEQAAAGPFNADLGWYDAIYKHNAKIADTLEKINEYLYARLTARTISVNGDGVQISGATRDIDQVAKAYLNLLRSPYISLASVSLTPGGATGGQPAGPGVGAMMSMNVEQGMGGGGMGMGMPGMRPGMMPGAGAVPAAPTAGNPNENYGVQFSFALLPQYGLGQALSGGGPGRGPMGMPGMGPGSGMGMQGMGMQGMGPGSGMGGPMGR